MKKDIKEIIKDIFNILEDSYEDRTHNTYCTTVTNLNKIKKRLRQIETLNRLNRMKQEDDYDWQKRQTAR